MDNVEAAEDPELADAVLRWTDPRLLDAVKAAERLYIPHQLNEFYRMTDGFCFRLLSDAEVGEPGRDSWMGRTSHEWLVAAWNALKSDFCRRLSTNIYLFGVQMAPTLETERRPIPQAWASDAKFDIPRGTIEVVGRRYVSVRASRIPPPVDMSQETAAAALVGREAGPARRQPITQDTIVALSDDEILLLLEEHAKRVINSPDAKLVEPGKISLIPIVRRKMVDRATRGELLPSLAAEALFLARWIAGKVEHFSTPSEGTISKVLGKDYLIEKARSKAAIQR